MDKIDIYQNEPYFRLSRSMFAKFPMDVIGYISKYHFKISADESGSKEEAEKDKNSNDEAEKSDSNSDNEERK